MVRSKHQLGNVCSSIANKDSLSVCGDDFKMARKEAKFGAGVDNADEQRLIWRKPTTCLDQVYLGCTQRERIPNNSLVDDYRKLFESRISTGATDKLPNAGKENEQVIAWSYDMAGHAQTCVERYCELTNRKRRAVIERLRILHR